MPDLSLVLSPQKLSAEFSAGETRVVSVASSPAGKAASTDAPEALLEFLAIEAPATTPEYECEEYRGAGDDAVRAYDRAVAEVTAAWGQLLVHESTPASASPRHVGFPDVNERRIRRQLHRVVLANIPRYRIKERREARERCAPALAAAIENAWQEASERYEQERLSAEREWKLLLAGDVERVAAALLTADFPDSTVLVDVSAMHVSLLCWVRGVDTMPLWAFDESDDGRRLVPADNRRRAAQHREHVLSAAIACTRTAFAAAPSIVTVHTALMQTGSKDVFGRPRFGVIAATSFERDVLDRVQFHNAPSKIVREAATAAVGTTEAGPFRWLTPDDSTDLSRLIQGTQAVP